MLICSYHPLFIQKPKQSQTLEIKVKIAHCFNLCSGITLSLVNFKFHDRKQSIRRLDIKTNQIKKECILFLLHSFGVHIR